MTDNTPTWECLRESRWMVVDHATLHFGVYPTTAGTVSMLLQQPGLQSPVTVTLCPDEIPLLCRQLACAQGFAERQREANAEAEAAQTTFDLLKRLKKGIQ